MDPRILVVGCVSFDTIHLENDRKATATFHTTGGAGLYTALAAAYICASLQSQHLRMVKPGFSKSVCLLAPRPEQLPDSLTFIEDWLDWIGPVVPLEAMPTLEIVHHGESRATLLGASWGAESLLRPDNSAVPALDSYSCAHVAALSSAGHQLSWSRHLRNSCGLLSAGTYARAIAADAVGVRLLLENSDFFFMNSNEAALLFATAGINCAVGQYLFVTDGSRGATLYESDKSAHIDAVAARELDPTGAGDTFCGAVLAGLAVGLDPLDAAARGAALASEIISRPGSEFYRL